MFNKQANINKPNFFVIGGAKCGTTALGKWLKEHPEIFVCNKETHYFRLQQEEGFKFLIRNQHKLARKLVNSEQQYLANFNGLNGVKNQLVIGEVCLSYLNAQSAEAIYQFNSNSKIIAVLRNPIDRAFSAYRHLKANNKIAQSFIELIQKEDILLYSNNINDPVSLIINSGLYGNSLAHYFVKFSKQQIKLYLFEDFAQNPLDTMQGIYRFLGVDDLYTPKDMRDFLIPANLPLAESAMHKLLDFDSFSRSNSPEIEQKLMQLDKHKLIKLFEQDIKLLENLSGLDCSRWLDA